VKTKPVTVSGDPVLLARLAANLLHNAVHYNRPGGTVGVELPADGRLTVRTKGKTIGGAKVADNDMIATAVRLRDEEELSLREIAGRLVIRTGKKRGEHPSPATVMVRWTPARASGDCGRPVVELAPDLAREEDRTGFWR
jgi:hypothetical protein